MTVALDLLIFAEYAGYNTSYLFMSGIGAVSIRPYIMETKILIDIGAFYK
jgi:hypothetical protein